MRLRTQRALTAGATAGIYTALIFSALLIAMDASGVANSIKTIGAVLGGDMLVGSLIVIGTPLCVAAVVFRRYNSHRDYI